MSKKTYKQFVEEQSDNVEFDVMDESISMALRKAKGRMMKKINALSKTKFMKKLNASKPMTMIKSMPKAAKLVRKTIMQKIIGKAKDLKDLAVAQKARLEDLTTKKMKAMGPRIEAMKKRFAKGIIKKHKERMIASHEKKAKDGVDKIAQDAKKAGVPPKEVAAHADKHKADISKKADQHAAKPVTFDKKPAKGDESEVDVELGKDKGKKPEFDLSKKDKDKDKKGDKKDDEKSKDKKETFKGFSKKYFDKK